MIYLVKSVKDFHEYRIEADNWEQAEEIAGCDEVFGELILEIEISEN